MGRQEDGGGNSSWYTLVLCGFAATAELPIPSFAQEASALPEVVVSGNRIDDGYARVDASTATKTDTPLIDTPFSIQVVTPQLLQDEAIRTVDQALVNVPGVRSSSFGWNENIYLRGFGVTGNQVTGSSTYLVNGFRIDDPNGLNGLANLANVESIEVMKGPASILYGQMEPGGIVNLTTRQPQGSAHYSVEQSFGSWQHEVTAIDATGPIDGDNRVRYRVNATYDRSQSWVDNVHDAKLTLAPVVEWRPDAATRLSLETITTRDAGTVYQQSNVPLTTANQLVLGPRAPDPAPYYWNPVTTFASLTWSHRIDETWSIRQMIVHNQADNSSPVNWSTGQSAGPYLVGTQWMTAVNLDQLVYSWTRSNGTLIDVTGHFVTGPARHTLLVGADYDHVFAQQESMYSNPAIPGPAVPLYGPVVPTALLSQVSLDPNAYVVESATSTMVGVYVQDQLALADGIHAMAGLRYQNIRTAGFSINGVDYYGTGLPSSATPQHNSSVTPRAGVLWRLRDWASIYAMYSQNFGANNTTDYLGNPLKPEGATEYELGQKSELLGGRLSASLAAFDLTKTNVASPDYGHPSAPGVFPYAVAIGRINSRGIEASLQGQILPGWDATAAYTYDKVWVAAETALYANGTRMPFVPAQMAHLFSTYRFAPESAISGWKVGGGVTWEAQAPGFFYNGSSRLPGDTTTLHAPSYAVVDLMAAYDFRVGRSHELLQFNVRNLFDRVYYTDVYSYGPGSANLNYGTPRYAELSLRVEL